MTAPFRSTWTRPRTSPCPTGCHCRGDRGEAMPRLVSSIAALALLALMAWSVIYGSTHLAHGESSSVVPSPGASATVLEVTGGRS